MRPEDIQNELGNIGSDLIERANAPRSYKASTHRRVGWVPLVAACLALVILLGVFLIPTRGPIPSLPSGRFPLTGTTQNGLEPTPTPVDPFLLLAPTYPACVMYPAKNNNSTFQEWRNAQEAKQRQFRRAQVDMNDFFISTMQEMLTETNGENGFYSPINIYVALSMIAEMSEGESREQLLALLGEESVSELREKIRALWESHYTNDGMSKLLLANSLWFDNTFTPKDDTMQLLADYYYASTFRGDMQDPVLHQSMSNWISEQTDGFMNIPAEALKPSPETIFKMISTIYFEAKWNEPFYPNRTVKETFYTSDATVKCDFMKDSRAIYYYRGEGFSAVALSMNGQGSMWFVLPDEGIVLSELLKNGEFCEFIQNPTDWENKVHATVRLSVPKFDISCGSDLVSMMKKLGVEDIFSKTEADFSPIGDGPICVQRLDHTARCKIEESGCKAAAVTIGDSGMESIPPELEFDFILNRPFYFQITSTHGTPLFAGVINDPTA